MSRAWTRPAAAVAGGLLLYVSFPPIGSWFLAPAGVALLTLAARGAAVRRAVWLGYLGGAAFLLPGLAWVRPIGYDAWLILVAVECLFLAAASGATALVTRLRWWPLWVAALWVAQEWARGRFPVGGFPWMRLAFAQGESPFTPYAALGGAPLVTFAVALCGALLAFAALRLTRSGAAAPTGRSRTAAPDSATTAAPGDPGGLRTAALLLAGVLAVPLLGYAVPRPAAEGGRVIRVGVVQGDVPGEGMGFLGDKPAVVLGNHARVTHEMAADVRAGRMPRPDIVIWPENSTDIDPYRSAQARQTIDAAASDIGVPILVGAIAVDPDGEHRRTRAIVWDPRTGPGAYYDKQQLVPFGEYVPYKALLEQFFSRVNLVGLQSLPGDRPGALRMGPVTIGAVSCYEVAFDGVVRGTVQAGGTPLAVQTNNATYARSNLPPQQLAMSQLRAVEHDRAVVIAATTGISAFVDHTGKIRWRGAEKVTAKAVLDVQVRTGQTLATRLGPLPEWFLLLAAAGAVGVAAARRRAPRRKDTSGGEDA
ncbi:apolipoprotein N-acyltransferase [Sphaerisporangium rubeum]|uniref:Apolipoprotein N-acyltransferase n=1 Tax=Sphaerisporangium rubeum TaxID=321317 RepID=A0A7X0M705_9ACTN|nr:apolipoprotein N-acyltransferase [Sphaerisporangium rubeum]MBB6473807.1 apolipoprotein N-acyltransferase [Sphaerisporangium rubeum]